MSFRPLIACLFVAALCPVGASGRTRLLAVAMRGRTVLVNPDGSYYRGIEQRWVARMHVASWVGRLTLSHDTAACQVPFWNETVPACAEHGQVDVSRGTDQFGLYHELGHEFDERYLSDHDHRILLRWLNQDIGGGLRFWWSPDVTTHAAEAFSGGEYFADFYASCAQGDSVNEDRRICRYVDLTHT
jgi:hypothetical protein